MEKFTPLVKNAFTQNERVLSGLLRIKSVLDTPEKYFDKIDSVGGWVRTCRKGNNEKMLFIELSDGSCHNGLQIVVEENMSNFKELLKTNVSACLEIKGKLVKSPAKGQLIEMLVNDDSSHQITIHGQNDDPKNYPLGGKKHHTQEHVRKFLHLRPKTKLIGAVARVRNSLTFATHKFFNSQGFLNVHTPLITSSDCEGAGEIFNVTTMIKQNSKIVDIPHDKKTQLIDFTKDFFSKAVFLTVSGQLDVEQYACGLTNVYTFGPTFRAEQSNTTRHLSEFWMIEPEICFAGMKELQELCIYYIKFCIDYCIENNLEDIKYFNDVYKRKNKLKDFDYVEYLKNISNSEFRKMSYTEAIDILVEHDKKSKKKFEIKPFWGIDLGSEHEKFLCEIVKGPIVLYDYPKDIKAFYMRMNDDKKTVSAVDVLIPNVGELLGGSVREERYEFLQQRMKDCGLNEEDYKEYLDLRKYGTVKHAGFGVGLERLVMFLTGLDNIREVIPYPRWPKHCGTVKE